MLDDCSTPTEAIYPSRFFFAQTVCCMALPGRLPAQMESILTFCVYFVLIVLVSDLL